MQLFGVKGAIDSTALLLTHYFPPTVNKSQLFKADMTAWALCISTILTGKKTQKQQNKMRAKKKMYSTFIISWFVYCLGTVWLFRFNFYSVHLATDLQTVFLLCLIHGCELVLTHTVLTEELLILLCTEREALFQLNFTVKQASHLYTCWTSTQCFLYIHFGVAARHSFKFLFFPQLSQIHHHRIISPPSQQSPVTSRQASRHQVRELEECQLENRATTHRRKGRLISLRKLIIDFICSTDIHKILMAR